MNKKKPDPNTVHPIPGYEKEICDRLIIGNDVDPYMIVQEVSNGVC